MKKLLIFSGVGFCIWFIAALIKPMDTSTARGIAVRTLDNIVKECTYKKAIKDANPTFVVPVLTNYKFTPINGNCDGDENNLLTAASENQSLVPTFSYNVETGEKTCFHDGRNKKLHGCSARKNGEW